MTFSPRFAALPLLLIAACSNAAGQSTAPDATQQVAPAALKSAVEDDPVRAFYRANGWQAVWSDAAERALRHSLEDRVNHGLDRISFLARSFGSPAEREAGLTRAALAYASAVAKGVADPASLYDIYTIPRPAPDLASGLAGALQNGNVGEWLADLAPKDEEYRALSKAYLQARAAANGGPSDLISVGDAIHTGDSDPRVPQIAEALRRGGYLAQGSGHDPSSTQYTPQVANAVRKMQRDRGIAVDGVVGPDTIKALNQGQDDRARAAAVALERRRWLTRAPPKTRIDVNTAEATLTYVRDGKIVDRRKVVVGQPGWRTPQLRANFYRLVANPTWTVPKSIEHKQMGDVGAAYLRHHNMERRNGYIVQLSGPDNALGLVKFDLDDDYAIYLHDTPSKALFDKNERHRSHGCIRVADALGFARMIASDEGISSEWEDARGKESETFVKLPNSIPVRLMYHPTSVSESGEVRYAQDVYGWNDDIATKLGFGAGRKGQQVSGAEDLGP